MAMITEFGIDPSLGEVFVELRANGFPIAAVLSTFKNRLAIQDENADPAIVRFRLPAVEERYVLYGVVTPGGKRMFAPSYERRLLQGTTLLRGRGRNPITVATHKVSEGEWVGTPEIIRIRLI